MKKILFIICLLLLITGCSNGKFNLESKYYEESKIIDTTPSVITELETNKESFAVFVYLNGCSSCSEFNEVLKDFINDNRMTFYKLEINDIEKTKINGLVKYAPSLVLYKNGEVVSYLNAESNDDLTYYKSSEKLKLWLEKYINLK